MKRKVVCMLLAGTLLCGSLAGNGTAEASIVSEASETEAIASDGTESRGFLGNLVDSISGIFQKDGENLSDTEWSSEEGPEMVVTPEETEGAYDGSEVQESYEQAPAEQNHSAGTDSGLEIWNENSGAGAFEEGTDIIFEDTENTEETGETEETEAAEISEELVAEIQYAIDALPTMEEYIDSSVYTIMDTNETVEEIKTAYFEELNEGERALVDPSALYSLDMNILKTNGIVAGKIVGDVESDTYLSSSQMTSLEERIKELPDLDEVVDISAISVMPDETLADAGIPSISYKDQDAEFYVSSEEMDRIYQEVYEISQVYFHLTSNQIESDIAASGEDTMEAKEESWLDKVFAFFSTEVHVASNELSAESAEKIQLWVRYFAEDTGVTYYTYDGTYNRGEFTTADFSKTYDKYWNNVYSAVTGWHYGYYEVKTDQMAQGSGSTTAFCMYPKMNGGMVSQRIIREYDIDHLPSSVSVYNYPNLINEKSRLMLKYVLYYGYGGPGEFEGGIGTFMPNASDSLRYQITHLALSSIYLTKGTGTTYTSGMDDYPAYQVCEKHALDLFTKNILNNSKYKNAENDAFIKETVHAWIFDYFSNSSQSWIYALYDIKDKPEPKEVSVYVQKISADPLYTVENEDYSLKGAVYEAYASEEDAENGENTIGILTTDENGKSEPIIVELTDSEEEFTFYVKEITPSPGYEICSEIHSVLVKAGETGEILCEEIPHREPEKPDLNLSLNKKDAGDRTTPLEGAIFAVKFWEMKEETDADMTAEPEKIWYFRTDKDGMIQLSNPSSLLETYSFSNYIKSEYAGKVIVSSEFDRDEEGNIQFDFGTYQIREICPAENYSMEGTMECQTVDGLIESGIEEGITLQLIPDMENHTTIYTCNSKIMEDENIEVSVFDEVHLNSMKLVKSVEKGNPFGTRFRVFDNENGAYITAEILESGQYEMTGLANTVEEATLFVPAEDGNLHIGKIPNGNYTLSEVATTAGNTMLKENIEFELPYRLTPEEAKEKNADSASDSCYFDEASGCYCFTEVTYNIKNGAKLSVPVTGGDQRMMYLCLMVALGMIAGGAMLMKKSRAR